ncbi:alpha/beta fold hydrolase [Rhodococcoides corynebacterioides]|uniref:alpha/beta fold hydrolase n=1 Tax=Rhodococcoides corynebacterioides TaxID=53972 RepID=UPI001C9AA7D7|nr:alpha/beta hydrolase [Rhodococcus corynebacterioides]MBY6364614.1 alpha/beta hydrolase [Rhodococcus corynebacterioides]
MRYFVDAGEDRRLDAASRTHLRGEFLALSAGVTHYELTGPDHGEVIVLPGGITVPLFYWDDTVAHLHEHGFRTLTYSAYGRGYSDRVEGRYNDDLFVGQLAELVAALGLPASQHVVGASMGALVGMGYALRQPHSVASLSLIGPAGVSPRPLAQRVMVSSELATRVVARHFGRQIFDSHQGRNLTDPVLSARLHAIVGDAYRYEGSLYAFFRTLADFPLFDRGELYRSAGLLPIPSLLMWGTGDRVTPIDSLDRVCDLLGPTEVEVVDDCGHMVPFERPRLVADAIASFIASRTGM